MTRSGWAIATLAATAALGAFLAAGARPAQGRGAVGGAAGPDLGARAVDLTYDFDERTIYWPTDAPFRWRKTKWGPAPDGSWYASATYSASEHGGTHLDSPVHFAEGGLTADAIPLAKLIGPAVVIDVTKACAADRDYRLAVADVAAWERAHGRIPDGAIVAVRTGWGKTWPDKASYLGDATPGDVAHLHFPGISREAAEFLARERKVSGVGIDTASLDHGPSRDFLAHRALTAAGLYGLENLAHLERLPEAGATLIALPMKIKGGSGGPTRVIAILP